MNSKIIWTDKYLCIELSSKFVLEDYILINNKIAGDSRYDDIAGIIIDSRRTEIVLSDKDLMVAGAVGNVFTNYNRKKLKFAYVAIPEQEELIENYIFNFGHKEWQRKIFHSIESAISWVEKGRFDEK